MARAIIASKFTWSKKGVRWIVIEIWKKIKLIPEFAMGTQPKWVQTPKRTSHSGRWTRSASVCGSRRVDMSTERSVSISAYQEWIWNDYKWETIWKNWIQPKLTAVRCRINSGLPRHLKVTFLPSGMSANLTSILARASTSADALIELTNSVTTVLAA